MKKIFIILLAFVSCKALVAQSRLLTLEQAIEQSMQNNGSIQAAQYEVQSKQQFKKASSEISKTSITGMFGQYNSYEKGDYNISISQTIPFPTVFSARSALGAAHVKSSELMVASTQNEVLYQVKSTWYSLAYLHELNTWYTRADSLWQALAKASAIRQRTGEATQLERITAESRYMQAQTLVRQNEADIEAVKKRLKALLASQEDVDTQFTALEPRKLPVLDTVVVLNNPQLTWQKQQITVAEKEKAVEKNLLAPDLTLGYFNQTLIGNPVREGSAMMAGSRDHFQGVEAGISIPLWFKPQVSKIKAAEFNRQASESRYQQQERAYMGEFHALVQEVTKFNTTLNYYQNHALPQADLILKQSDLGFRNGELDYVELIQSITIATDLHVGFLQTLNNYNQAVLKLEYLLAEH